MASHTIQQSAFSWNVRLEKLVKDGQHMKAINYFRHMEAERVSMDTFTFVSVLNACAHLRTLNEGRRIHAKIIQSGFECHIFVGNGLINMYAKCGSIVEARRVFNNMVARDVVSWNAMVVGYVKCGDGLKALELFLRMRQGGVEPNTITFVGSLNACASLAALEQGRLIHEQIRQMGLESDPFLECCLIDMYTKCGSITDARKVFDNMGSHNVVPWNAMILGYALHGLGKEALRLFDQMCKAGAEINSSTFVSLLTACNHGGLVDEGEYCLESMNAVYGIEANLKHYSSLVDLLGRCGHLGGAEDMVTKMWCQPDHLVWMTLLSACNTHGNMRLGEKAAKRLLQLDPENTAAYVLLSNIYGTFGVWPYQPHSKNNENMICT
ncbi:hypothetical protein O6H91_08G040200 [Diphasiastrum complanatum]|nr:hypothetical protein O6H91_08G040200 [Diphasiastrum complanatum]